MFINDIQNQKMVDLYRNLVFTIVNHDPMPPGNWYAFKIVGDNLVIPLEASLFDYSTYDQAIGNWVVHTVGFATEKGAIPVESIGVTSESRVYQQGLISEAFDKYGQSFGNIKFDKLTTDFAKTKWIYSK